MTETLDQLLARDLSFYQWEFLADHFEGPRPIRPGESRTRLSLAHNKLLKVDQMYKPTCTILTKRGHAVMCAAMGLMADVLIRTQHLKPGDVQRMERYGYGKCLAPARHSPDGEVPVQPAHRS